jgi:hypothetical protein
MRAQRLPFNGPAFRGRWAEPADLLPVAGPRLGIDPNGGRSSTTMLGTRLRSHTSRTIDGLEIVGRDVSGRMMWRLRVVDDRSDTASAVEDLIP